MAPQPLSQTLCWFKPRKPGPSLVFPGSRLLRLTRGQLSAGNYPLTSVDWPEDRLHDRRRCGRASLCFAIERLSERFGVETRRSGLELHRASPTSARRRQASAACALGDPERPAPRARAPRLSRDPSAPSPHPLQRGRARPSALLLTPPHRPLRLQARIRQGTRRSPACSHRPRARASLPAIASACA